MRIFVFEYITGGGMFSEPGQPLPGGSLLAEGRAMIQAVTGDLLAIPGSEVFALRDTRLAPLQPPGCQVTVVDSASSHEQYFQQLVDQTDAVLLIAPETGGALLRSARLVEAAGKPLISPSALVIELAGNKQLLAEWLEQRRVPTTHGHLLNPGDRIAVDFAPAVLKPIDGCGSQDVCLLRTAGEINAAIATLKQPMRLERFVPGLAASVAVLCRPGEHLVLPACAQRLSTDGRFSYLGGATPLAPGLDNRARNLALAAALTLPNPVGYIGVDLVLSEDPTGSGDVVIEINPRLTTSYVGLRKLCRENLAAAMLAIALGQPASISFHALPIEFAADGTILRAVNA